jgi:hypothetical protein
MLPEVRDHLHTIGLQPARLEMLLARCRLPRPVNNAARLANHTAGHSHPSLSSWCGRCDARRGLPQDPCKQARPEFVSARETSWRRRQFPERLCRVCAARVRNLLRLWTPTSWPCVQQWQRSDHLCRQRPRARLHSAATTHGRPSAAETKGTGAPLILLGLETAAAGIKHWDRQTVRLPIPPSDPDLSALRLAREPDAHPGCRRARARSSH